MSEIVERLRGTLTGHATDDEMWERVIREREEAAAIITRLTEEVERLTAENTHLRKAWADAANNANIVGSAYDKAIKAVDEMMMTIKRQAHAALSQKETGNDR